jgi:hypothetical protein
MIFMKLSMLRKFHQQQQQQRQRQQPLFYASAQRCYDLPYDENYALDKAAVPQLITSWPNAAI